VNAGEAWPDEDHRRGRLAAAARSERYGCFARASTERPCIPRAVGAPAERLVLDLRCAEDRAYAFGVFSSDDERLVGRVALANIVRASWQNATLGYFIGQHFSGRGLATQAVRLTLQVAFDNLSLHRVQAAAMPRNSASIRVLEKTGFVREGLARRYLEINGIWEDHLLYAVTVEEWRL